jgi:hypothetical protein
MKSISPHYWALLFLLFASCSKDPLPAAGEALLFLDIEFEGSIEKDTKTAVEVKHEDNGKTIFHQGKIERRGGFSLAFPKHSYEIDFQAEYPLAGLPMDDDWILNANYIDKTFLRHVMAYELFMEMNKQNKASACRYVEVALNGVYNGLYILMEKLDKSSLDIDGNDTAAVIFKEPHIFRETYTGIVPQEADNFHQQTYPAIEDADKRLWLESVRDFIQNSNDDDFTSQLPEVFDLDNLLDWHLLLLISNNSDGILKNFYLYKQDKHTPIRIAPWDYDHGFGRDGDNALNLDEHPLDMERSILFRRLLQFDWYKGKLKSRWEDLNKADVLSENGLKQRISSKSEAIANAAKKNFEVWPIDSPWYYDDNNFGQEIAIMLQFISLRHSRLRDYFENL